MRSKVVIILIVLITDESYSKLMLGEGASAVVDEDSSYVMELPSWADEQKIKM